MTLVPGTRLGAYEILSPLGAGGMGEVYRARDTKLGREVAIKLLPEHLAANAEARTRFEREASAIAALKHPNIVTIYSIEDSSGAPFMVMELVEGRTLDAVVAEGGLSLEKFLDVAVPLADAVATAHDKGIIHRDLKPSNILVETDGRVKVLDFGLAKLAESASVATDKTISSNSHTQDGQILGTVAYMSPEQAEGLPVDHRSDIFSLGIVLYQMATGTNPFQRQTLVSTLSAILKDTPPSIAEEKRALPPALNEMVARCLAKLPENRYQTCGALRNDLRALQARTTAASQPASVLGMLRKPRIAVPVLFVVAVLIAGAAWFQHRSSRARWARQVALPEIERVLDATPGGSGMWAAFDLGVQAKRYLPDDPALIALEKRYAIPLTVHSDPPGATVYAKPYAAGDDAWRTVGTTPIDTLPFVRGVFSIRLERDGFERVDDLFWSGRYDTEGKSYVLKPAGDVPEGMVWVPENAPRPLNDGVTEGVHLPGIEHLPPQKLGSFYVDRYEVTNKAYKRFVDAGGYSDPKFWKQAFVDNGKTLPWQDAVARFLDKTQRPGPATWEVGDYPSGKDDFPVTGISWYEAAAYAEFAGKSLPSIYHWDQVALTWASGDIVPVSNLSKAGPARVGGMNSMNRYGAHDLAGNAREWCANATSRGDRFILGGGWDDPPYGFNDAYAQSPWDRSETNGVRCIQYVGTGVDRAAVDATVEVPHRDFMNEPAVSQETFALFLNQFRYDAAPLNAVIEETLETDDYVRQKIVFDAAYGGERMAAYLFLPRKGKPPYQTVVNFPGSGSIHTRSSADLAPGSSQFILKSGRAFLWPVLKSTYERGDELSSDYPDETNFYKDHVVMWVKDIMRSVDYLETRTDIDTGRLAFQGSSWGAAEGPIVLAAEPRFKAAVLIVAGLLFQRSQPEADPVNYVRHTRLPVLMLNGKYDFFFPYETSQVPFFELLGTPREHKKLVLHEAGHSVPATDRARESLAWLDKYLGPVQ